MKVSKTDPQLMRMLLKKIGPIDPDLIIAADPIPFNGVKKYAVKLNDKRASDAEVANLKREVELFEQTSLFKILTETLRYQAHMRMFEQSEKSEDVYISGKFLLHAISTLEHIMVACKNPLYIADQKLSTPRQNATRQKPKLTE